MGDVIKHPATPVAQNNLISYKVVDKDGGGAFVIIVNKSVPLKELNRLLRNGMSVTAIDERSALVDKRYVD